MSSNYKYVPVRTPRTGHRGGHRAPGGRRGTLRGVDRGRAVPAAYPRGRGLSTRARAVARPAAPPPRRGPRRRAGSRASRASSSRSGSRRGERHARGTPAPQMRKGNHHGTWKSYGYVVEIVETSPASNTPETYPSFGPTRGADSFKSTVVSRAGAGGALRSSRDAPTATRRLCSRQCVWELARRVRIESERSFESMLTTARPYRIGTGVSDRSRAQAAPGAPLSRTGDSFSSFWMLAGALDRLA